MNVMSEIVEARMRTIAERLTAEVITAGDVEREYRCQYGETLEVPDLLGLADFVLRELYDPASLPMPDTPEECRAQGEALLRKAEALERWAREHGELDGSAA